MFVYHKTFHSSVKHNRSEGYVLEEDTTSHIVSVERGRLRTERRSTPFHGVCRICGEVPETVLKISGVAFAVSSRRKPPGSLRATRQRDLHIFDFGKILCFEVGNEEQVEFSRSAELKVAAERKVGRGTNRSPSIRLESGPYLKTTVLI